MNICAHIEKWRRFDNVRSRFDPIGEFEVWYWSTLSGAMAMINAALHACGITKENSRFATQIPDVYAVMDNSGRWHYEIDVQCDLIHVGLPEIGDEIPRSIQNIFDAMHELEIYRDPYVRGLNAVTAQVVSNCDNAYGEIVRAASAVVEMRKR